MLAHCPKDCHNNLGKVRLLRMAYLGDAAAWGDAVMRRMRARGDNCHASCHGVISRLSLFLGLTVSRLAML